ncbi:hypothetical protein SMMN14_09225 [Sphaerulina musiva]
MFTKATLFAALVAGASAAAPPSVDQQQLPSYQLKLYNRLLAGAANDLPSFELFDCHVFCELLLVLFLFHAFGIPKLLLLLFDANGIPELLFLFFDAHGIPELLLLLLLGPRRLPKQLHFCCLLIVHGVLSYPAYDFQQQQHVPPNIPCSFVQQRLPPNIPCFFG